MNEASFSKWVFLDTGTFSKWKWLGQYENGCVDLKINYSLEPGLQLKFTLDFNQFELCHRWLKGDAIDVTFHLRYIL